MCTVSTLFLALVLRLDSVFSQAFLFPPSLVLLLRCFTRASLCYSSLSLSLSRFSMIHSLLLAGPPSSDLVLELPVETFAASLGLPLTPKISFGKSMRVEKNKSRLYELASKTDGESGEADGEKKTKKASSLSVARTLRDEP